MMDEISKKIEEGVFADTNYQKVFISVFDHWLNEDEAEKQIISYNPFDQTDEKRAKIYDSYEANFLSFLESLFLKYTIYLFKEGDFLEVAHKDSLKDFCFKALRDNQFSFLYIKALDILIEGGYDFTFTMFFKSERSLDAIKGVIAKNGLYTLMDE